VPNPPDHHKAALPRPLDPYHATPASQEQKKDSWRAAAFVNTGGAFRIAFPEAAGSTLLDPIRHLTGIPAKTRRPLFLIG
jgi:hypothetical protein